MRRALPAILILGGALAAQAQQSAGSPQAQASKDACAPPPGSVAPTLPAKLLEGQGGVHFPITTKSKEAQAFFDQGVSQMHSFWAREAERSFLQAAALDPEAPMPHWGIAMAAVGDFRPGFQLGLVNGADQQRRGPAGRPVGGRARAIEAAKKAQALAAVTGKATEVEKMYIAAIAARRDLAAKDPNAAYVAGLRKLIAAYPKEVEARSYLALQIMSGFVLPQKTPRAGSMEAVALLRELLKDAPDHAGVHHYVIHGWEGSSFAKEAWPSCDRYGKLASNIPHGLHMPGHIYAQTGRWEDAALAFSAAANNELYWLKQDSLATNQHHGHNVHFLAASYSFHGDYDKAMESARSLLEFKETPREQKQKDAWATAYGQGWFALMRTLVQHEKWDLILDGTSLPEFNKPRWRGWRHWARAQALLAKGNVESGRAEMRAMEQAMKDWKREVEKQPNPQLQVAFEELKGHIDLAAGKTNAGLKRLERAAVQERALRYNEPPQYPRPVYEVLGKSAMRHGRKDLAIRAFRQALEQYPESRIANDGLRAALGEKTGTVPAGGN
jgi:tetratricopeptide (TPR) repeat protein